MKKRLIIIVGVFLILLSNVWGAGTVYHWWDMTSNYIDIIGGVTATTSGIQRVTTYPVYNLTGNGTTHGAQSYSLNDEFDTNVGNATMYNGAYSLSMWIKFNYTGATDQYFHGFVDGTQWFYSYDDVSAGQLKTLVRAGTGNSYTWAVTNATYNDNDWHLIVMTWGESANFQAGYKFYFDGVLDAGTYGSNNAVSFTSNDNMDFFNYDVGASGSSFIGSMDNIMFFKGTLSAGEVANLYNCNNITLCSTPSDTAPPVIIFNKQNPPNITTVNVMSTVLNISYNITDALSNLNASTIYINYTVINGSFYINGSLVPAWKKLGFSSYDGAEYRFILDDNDVYSATYNYNHSTMENITHLPYTLTGLAQYIKVEFYNVSNATDYNIVEAMSENATATPSLAEYYYCNDLYTTGNPTTDANCVLFWSELNNKPYNHTHKGGNSKHKVFPLGINVTTGRINNVPVTPVSYILKRGSVTGERFYYILNASRNDAHQYTTNNGNTWTSLNDRTFDMHIHQISIGEALNYSVCASDDAGNKNCSHWRIDFIDFNLLPPSSLAIYSPIATVYNETNITIRHSYAYSSSGANITSYEYFYGVANTTTTNYIGFNNASNIQYAWNITGFTNGFYFIAVLVNDSNNLSSLTYSENFRILIPYSYSDNDTLLLIDINATTKDINSTLSLMLSEVKNISGGIEMIALIILLCVLLVVGLAKYKIALFFAGLNMIWISLLQGANLINETGNKAMFYKYGSLGFLVLGILISLIGLLLAFFSMNHNYSDNEQNRKQFRSYRNDRKDFYPKY